jgi:tetratricopeptide (TPR) repeat protein
MVKKKDSQPKNVPPASRPLPGLEPPYSPSDFHRRLQPLIARQRYNELLQIIVKFKKSHGDLIVRQVWLVSLIRLERYGESIKLLGLWYSSTQDHPFLFELAYCYYRLNRLNEAQTACDLIENQQSKKVILLRAQILYRLEEYAACLDSYIEVKENNLELTEVDHIDIETNRLAVQSSILFASGSWYSDESDIQNFDLDTISTYEQCYNLGCVALASGLVSFAVRALEHARRLAAELYPHPKDKDLLSKELVPVLVQLGYAYQLKGDYNSAKSLYTFAITMTQSKRNADWLIATNNLYGLLHVTGELPVYDLEKKMRPLHRVCQQERLPQWLRDPLHFNSSLVTLTLKKVLFL